MTNILIYCSAIPLMTTFGLIPIRLDPSFLKDLFVRSEMNQNILHPRAYYTISTK